MKKKRATWYDKATHVGGKVWRCACGSVFHDPYGSRSNPPLRCPQCADALYAEASQPKEKR